MAQIFKELYRNGVLNDAINAAASQTFCITATDQERKRRFGSFNKILIVNSSSNAISIALDGSTDRTTLLPSTGSYEIYPEEGLFFNTVVITNNGGSQIAASAISLNYAIVTPVDIPTGLEVKREQDDRIKRGFTFGK